MSNDIITISNSSDTFDIFTDEQVVAFVHEHAYPIKIPVDPVNDMLRNTTKNTIQADGARQVGLNAVLYKVWTSGYVDLHHIRHLYLTSITLGTYNSMALNGEWGILKKIPVSADYNHLVNDQTALGTDYLDCSNQTLSLIEFKAEGPQRTHRQSARQPCEPLHHRRQGRR